MEDVVEGLVRGNVSEVKAVLASVVSALAIYQVFLMAVGYGKLKLPFLGSRPASRTHRAVGDTVVVVTLVVHSCVSHTLASTTEGATGGGAPTRILPPCTWSRGYF
jgi:Family of unknown function (DUF6529)